MKKSVKKISQILMYKGGDLILESYMQPFISKKIPPGLINEINLLKSTAAHHQVVSLAANQISINRRMFVVLQQKFLKPGKWKQYENAQPEQYQIVINPTLLGQTSLKLQDFEECPSLEGLRFNVWVPIQQKFSYLSPQIQNEKIKSLQQLEKQLKSFHTRVWDHQTRHLDGILAVNSQISHLNISVSDDSRANHQSKQYVKLLKKQLEVFHVNNIENMTKFVNKKNTSSEPQNINDLKIPDQITPEMKKQFEHFQDKFKKQLEKAQKIKNKKTSKN